MLPKENRLTKKKDFEKTFKKGKKYSLPGIKAYLKVVSNNLSQSRFGFIISKKVSKKAVVRNKIRRRIREIIRVNYLKIKKGYDVALVVLPGFEENNFHLIKKKLFSLFQKAKLIIASGPWD